jgi:hypothetical protein
MADFATSERTVGSNGGDPGSDAPPTQRPSGRDPDSISDSISVSHETNAVHSMGNPGPGPTTAKRNGPLPQRESGPGR